MNHSDLARRLREHADATEPGVAGPVRSVTADSSAFVIVGVARDADDRAVATGRAWRVVVEAL